jgi:hypothetical protein
VESVPEEFVAAFVLEMVDEFLLESLFFELTVLVFSVVATVDFVELSFESLFPELHADKTNNALSKIKYFFMMEHLHP